MTTTSATQMETKILPQRYNGWANYETWNVALWMQNDKFLYNTAVACVEYHNAAFQTPYDKFIINMENCNKLKTSDGVSWDHEMINCDEINEMMFEMHEGGEI
jgi:hypothetical protein